GVSEVSRIRYCAAPPPTTNKTMITARIVSVFLIGGSCTPLSWQRSTIQLAVGCLCAFVDQSHNFLNVLVCPALLNELAGYSEHGEFIVWVARGVRGADELVFHALDIAATAGHRIEVAGIGVGYLDAVAGGGIDVEGVENQLDIDTTAG